MLKPGERSLNYIESLRGIAALSVAIFHFTHFQGLNQKLIESETIRQVTIYGAQGVELFYMISGFIIPFALYKSRYQLKNYFQYLSKRIFRLIPPYLITIGLIYLVSYVSCKFIWYTEFDINFKQLFVNVFFIADLFKEYDWINPIFATLKVELQFYILIGLLFTLLQKNDFWMTLILAVLLWIGVLTRTVDTAFVNMPYFMSGFLFFKIYINGYRYYYLLLQLSIFAILIHYYSPEDIWVTLIATALFLYLPKQTKFLKTTGKISYSYYLIHGLTGGQILYFTQDLMIWKNQPFLMIVIALTASWVVALAMFWLIEKPCLQFVSKIKYN